ncbi:zinc finger and BTB domain-containing protein 49-like [Rhagoletis pomonella]|uniref:zinc finger and BTB domain-containing protein 49-like n=1 Tax=Rhagoletis pomonella TaxID=28610 RepID=UPI001785DE86|nr:zinc finger and BTB domain-containing protein 49-like [Rhagoletis pomonella]
MESNDVQVVAFDDEQMFAVGRALKAVADQVYETPKIEPITYSQEEIIELLSDSENATDNDDGSDCEIFGEICTNLEPFQEEVKLEPCNEENTLESQILNSGEQLPTHLSNGVVNNFSDRAVLNNDADAIAHLNYRESITQKQTTAVFSNNIIVLDDDDEDQLYNENGAEENNDENNSGLSDEEEKEKKCIDLLELDSDDNNQPSTSSGSKVKSNTYNLEAFLVYLCPQCGVSCDNIKKWNAHTDIVHNFRSISKLNLKTVISRQGVLSYQCNSCEKKFTSDTAYNFLLSHRIRHMTIPEFLRCRLCEERFSSRNLFLKHFKKKHSKVALQKLRRTEAIRCHMRFICPICKKKSKNLGDWTEHLDEAHDWYQKLPEKVTTIRDNLVECKTCAATFRTKQTKFHSLRHEPNKPFHCKLCKNHSAYSLDVVAKHIRVEHFKETSYDREYRCNYCDKVFERYARRIAHMAEEHTIELLRCDVCRKRFNSTAGLLTHMTKLNHRKIK